ncbi:MAG: glycosyl hydrolase [Planctomycetota bacterium]|nr:glycosyl hydrolase [Planctomycetota bacterium]
MKRLFPLIILLGCSSNVGAQEADFAVQFGGTLQPIPPGLVYGLNDLQHTSQGVWDAWSQGVKPEGGVVRIWVQRYLGQFSKKHIDAARRAQQAGLDVMLTVVGATGDEYKKSADDSERSLKRPSDTSKWAQQLAQNVREMINAGINVRYIEIWNEPDMPFQWDGTQEQFAEFFAECGVVLREEFGHSVKIGGPGMASGWGLGMLFFEKILDACKRHSFSPDFLSWHLYGSFASDNEYFRIPQTIQSMAETRGLGTPDTVLSEWNVSLPRPVARGMDTNVGAAYWTAVVGSLIQTPAKDALYFFLQDGSWEATKDFAGQSVGAFTLRGAPKSTFSAMKLMGEVAKSPAVPLQRLQAPNNLVCVATRNKQQGNLLISNSPGDILRLGRKFLANTSLFMGDLKGKDSLLMAHLSGKTKFDKLDLSEEWRVPLVELKKLMKALRHEEGNSNRWVTIKLDHSPVSIKRVRLIDADHGNPIASASFRDLFRPYEVGFGKVAGRLAIEELRKQGVSSSEVAAIEQSFLSGSKEIRIVGVSATTIASARATLNRKMAMLKTDLPVSLAAHEACRAAEVDSEDWVKIEGSKILVKVPPHSVVAVELKL